MNNPFFETKTARLVYLAIWLLLTISLVIAFTYTFTGRFVSSFFYFSICDIASYHVFFSLFILIVWYPVRYYRNVLSVPLFLLFHLVLLTLILAISIASGYWISSLVFSHYPESDFFLWSMLPFKLFSGLLFYILFVLFYYLSLTTSEVREQAGVIEQKEEAPETVPVEKLSRISVKKNKEIQFIPVNEIFFIEANGDYVLIHTAKGRFLKDRTMKYWEAHLPEEWFVRVHRSFIVNLEYIGQMDLYEKDSYRLRMKNDAILKVSQSGYKLLKQKMQ